LGVEARLGVEGSRGKHAARRLLLLVHTKQLRPHPPSHRRFYRVPFPRILVRQPRRRASAAHFVSSAACAAGLTLRAHAQGRGSGVGEAGRRASPAEARIPGHARRQAVAHARTASVDVCAQAIRIQKKELSDERVGVGRSKLDAAAAKPAGGASHLSRNPARHCSVGRERAQIHIYCRHMSAAVRGLTAGVATEPPPPARTHSRTKSPPALINEYTTSAKAAACCCT
jgi:hypothetical protein